MSLIVPSLLAFNFAQLQDGLELIRRSGAKTVHVDVCDGHFAPGITVGQPVIESLRKATSLELELHLLVERPERMMGDFSKAGARRIAIHPESTPRFFHALREIHAEGCEAGAVLGGATGLERIGPALEELDFLILTLEETEIEHRSSPGVREPQGRPARSKGAGSGLANTIRRLQAAVEVREKTGSQFTIEVEGAIDPNWVPALEESGADVLIMSRATESYPNAGALLHELMRRASDVSGAIAIKGSFHRE